MLIQVKARSVGFSIQIGSMYLEGGCLLSASLSSSFYWLFNFLLFSFCYLFVCVFPCEVCSVFFSVAMFTSPLTFFFFFSFSSFYSFLRFWFFFSLFVSLRSSTASSPFVQMVLTGKSLLFYCYILSDSKITKTNGILLLLSSLDYADD